MLHLSSILVVVTICGIATIAQAQNKDLAQPNTEITSPPSDEIPIYLAVGERLELECTDSDGYDVEWTKNSTKINSNTESQFVITTSKKTVGGHLNTVSTLAKEEVTFDDSSTYECKAVGSDSSHRTNVIIFEITSKPVNFTSNKVPLVLKCDVKGLTSNNPVTWYRDGKKIVPDQYHKTDDFNNTLTIFDPADVSAGIYTCMFVLTNTRNYSHEVHVHAIPRVPKFDKSKNLVQGDPLVLDCIAHGWPAPSIQWIKDTFPIDPTDPRITFTNKGELINASMRIENMDFADRAEYGCIANNSMGSHNSTIMVRVKDKLAALWPFLGICAEVTILCLIIFIYEKRRAKKMEEEDAPEETGHLTNSHDHKNKDDIRHRK